MLAKHNKVQCGTAKGLLKFELFEKSNAGIRKNNPFKTTNLSGYFLDFLLGVSDIDVESPVEVLHAVTGLTDLLVNLETTPQPDGDCVVKIRQMT